MPSSDSNNSLPRRPLDASRLLSWLLCCLLCLAPSLAQAQEGRELEASVNSSLPILGISSIGLLSISLLGPKLAPKHCRLCDENPLDAALTDALALPEQAKAIALSSDIVDFAVLPSLSALALGLSAGLEGRPRAILHDYLILGEAVAVSTLFNQLLKYSVLRARPYTHRHPELYPNAHDPNLSFYSGHTALAFSIVVAAGSIAHFRNYKAEPYIWGLGLPLAGFVAYARMAAEKHYFTDVLAGALLGSLIGFLVPYLHRNLSPSTTQTTRLSISSPFVSLHFEL